ncbi:ABC-three component system middle component 1 [Sphingobacterium hungaricum]|uniref:Uncharacterized protein n=1 Tax=Sphingobacterium hungaricum TaxID=2082723 RepID=A0A928YQZ8_9SPHI|nr:ABC-three component system middle component 1 [Sphingobacterium hungaricum]MBE8714791.1 hypothetical protein [Sphingobacterium hungaricum]
MNNISTENRIKTLIIDLYPDVEVTLHIETYISKIHTFFVKFPSEASLAKDWENLSNSIAVYYQSQLPDEFEIWNLYLFYITESICDKHLKYKIENDTVSSRKILLSYNGEVNNEFIATTVEEHITNKNLELLPEERRPNAQKTDFERNPLLWEVIRQSGIIDDKKAIVKPSSVLELLEQKIKDEIQKS